MPEGLIIKIGADVQEAVRAIGKVTDNLEELADTGRGSLNSVTLGLQELRAAAAGAGNATELGTFNRAIKQLSAEQANLRKVGLELTNVTKAGSGLGSIGTQATKALTGLRTLAAIIPGIGIGGLLSLGVEPIVKLFKALADGSNDAANATKRLTDVIDGTSKSYEEAVTNVSSLRLNIDLAKKGFIDKDLVVNQYNKTIGETVGKVKTLDEAEQGLNKNADAYIKFTLLKAAANIALGKAAEQAFKAAAAPLQDIKKNIGFFKELQLPFAGAPSRKGQETKFLVPVIEGFKKEEKEFLSIAENFNRQAAQISKDFKFDFFGGKQDIKAIVQKLADELRRIADIRDKVNIPVGINLLDLEKEVATAVETINARGLRKSAIDIPINVPKIPVAILKEMQEQVEVTASIVSNTLTPAFEDLFTSILQGQASLSNFFQSLGNQVTQLISRLAAAAAVAGILSLLTGGATGSLGGFSKIFQGFTGLKFAEGGVVFGPTLAMIGEGKTTNRSNPEIVAPLDKLKSLIGKSGSNQRIGVDIRMRARDLIGVANREDRSQRRLF